MVPANVRTALRNKLGLDDRAGYWAAHAELIRDAVLERAWK